ncbi:uncharacterized protein LOC143922722 isoform X2 [Arctopsyche grandis]|uniref:uncharacterized protein LOC143922722 isoform X2 n=1 Tax=Arctopsyche grandis TaxID=121162 RepID=UPI00406D93C4
MIENIHHDVHFNFRFFNETASSSTNSNRSMEMGSQRSVTQCETFITESVSSLIM